MNPLDPTAVMEGSDAPALVRLLAEGLHPKACIADMQASMTTKLVQLDRFDSDAEDLGWDGFTFALTRVVAYRRHGVYPNQLTHCTLLWRQTDIDGLTPMPCVLLDEDLERLTSWTVFPSSEGVGATCTCSPSRQRMVRDGGDHAASCPLYREEV
jgi:hypothetical protein